MSGAMLPSHPIHEFPNELLAQIFKCGTDTSLETLKDLNLPNGQTIIPPLPFPMLMCAVCSHWRQLALDTPDLWNTIYIPLFVSTSGSRTTLIFDAAKFTSIWLERSKATPLTVLISIPNSEYAFDVFVNVILPKIVEHANRLHNFVIHGDATGLRFCNIRGIMQSIGVNLVGDSIPIHLLSLSFDGRGTGRFPSASYLLDRDWDLPDPPPAFNVKELHMHGIRLDPRAFPHLISLSVSQLEATYLELFSVFDALPCLRELSLPLSHVLSSTPSTHVPLIIVPSLLSLSISFYRRPLNSTAPYPIAFLKLPNLNVLHLDGDASIPFSSCFAAVLASSSNLKTLRLSNFARFSRDFSSPTTLNDIQFLHRFTTIEDLELIHATAEAFLPSSQRVITKKRSIGHRGQIASQLAETSRTLDQVFQNMRLNGQHQPPSPDTTEFSVPSIISQTDVIWPNLQRISLDTLYAEDLVALCHYISEKPNIESVRLSKPALRHLSYSMRRKKGEDKFYFPFRSKKPVWDADKSDGIMDAEDWLRKRVELSVFKSTPLPRGGWDYQ